MRLMRRKEHPAVRVARENGPTLLLGAAVGGVLIYMLDAEGRQRRKLAREKTARASRRTARTLEKRARDVRNRAQGLVAETRSRLTRDDANDEKLVARVRAQLGHHVGRASTIDTSAEDGTVTLRGSVLAAELGDVLACVRAVRGVRSVRNELAVYEDAAELQSRA